MKIKENKGFIAVDMIVAIMAIMIFSVLIFSMTTNNFLENLKVRKETLSTIYITEIFENIGIATYDEVVQQNVSNLIPENVDQNNYKVDLNIEDEIKISENQNENIIKKVTVTISYELAGKNYNHTMSRIKIKE